MSRRLVSLATLGLAVSLVVASEGTASAQPKTSAGDAALAEASATALVRDMVTSIDADKRVVKLAGGSELAYDRLIVSPGVDFMWETLPGMNKPGAQDKVLHSFKAGPQTVALRRQLEAMPDGCRSRWLRTAARPAPMSAPVRWRTISARPSPRARC